MTDPDDRLDVFEIAELLVVDPQRVRDILRLGLLPGEKVTLKSGQPGWVARRDDVEAYREARPRVPSRPRRAGDPMEVELGELTALIEEATRRRDDLFGKRDERMAAWVDDHHRSIGEVAKAADLTKQRAAQIVRIQRARREGQQDPKS